MTSTPEELMQQLVGTLTYDSVEDARNNEIVYRASVRLLASQDFERIGDFHRFDLSAAMAEQSLRKQIAQPKCPSSWRISPRPNEWYYACQEGLEHARAAINCIKVPKDLEMTNSSYGDGSTRDLLKYIKLADDRIDALQAVLRNLPACPMHGTDCLSYYVEWIEAAGKVFETLRGQKLHLAEPMTEVVDRLIAARDQIIADNAKKLDSGFYRIFDPNATPVEQALREDLYLEYTAARTLLVQQSAPAPDFRSWLEDRAIGLMAESGLRQIEIRRLNRIIDKMIGDDPERLKDEA